MAENEKKKTGTDIDVKNDSVLDTQRGRTSIDDVVVAKIAGIAAREVSGVHDLGGGAARMVGALRDSFNAGTDVRQGVDVEVGETEAAADVAIIAEYGVAIHELAEAIRQNVIDAIESMTGLKVTEVNVVVHDVNLPKDENEDEEESAAPRVN
ncbi:MULTISPECIES: Asp23/Gls24 family envelope stress response protein [Corynebacterium]|uniref:Asp23/Gls24 family envelope stress response protein n=1 Tax=Corynebacterium TaxID=1716 RepID=UPI00124CEF18|nr:MULTISPECIES: Asp23/Gls24 family envelope stress response protein [Corynebacterium]